MEKNEGLNLHEVEIRTRTKRALEIAFLAVDEAKQDMYKNHIVFLNDDGRNRAVALLAVKIYDELKAAEEK